MKTKVIMEGQNDYAKQKNKNFEMQYMKAMLLALLESKKISPAQYEKCRERLGIL